MTPANAAQWMAATVRRTQYLDHAQVIDYLMTAEPKLVAYNDAGNPTVAKSVLAAFRALKPADIVWSMSSQHWRLREAIDPPGRRVP